MNRIEILTKLTEKTAPRAVEFRRYLHTYPELSQQESNTASFISGILDEAAIGNSITDKKGVIATLYGTKYDSSGTNQSYSPAACAIRADIDALPIQEKTGLSFSSVFPGKMHACGHDMHTAILMGTALVLAQAKELIKGCVRFLFQPAEETVGGAKDMINAGALENPKVSAVLGLHVNPDLPCGNIGLVQGTMTAASTEFTLHINGCGCHGAHPERGADPVLASSAIIMALQSIVSRNISPVRPSVITVGSIYGGTKGNIIPGNVICKGIIRALTNHERDFIKERVLAVCTSTAQAMGCSCSVSFCDSYPALENDNRMTEFIKNLASEVLGKENVLISCEPSMGADDFAYFAQSVPSLYFDLGVGSDSSAAEFPLHSEKFNPNEDAIKTGILMESLAAVRLLELVERQ